jgi:type IV pilus assembly protein PilF
MKMARWVLLLCSLALLACASQESKESQKDNARKAAETNTALGRQYLERGQYEIALEKLKRAVNFDDSYAPAYTMLGVLYETIGEMDQAGVEYRHAVEADPSGGDVNNNYGVYLCGTGKSAEAVRYFTAAVKDPFYQTPEVAYANAGTCALRGNDLDKAETYLRQSLEYDADLGAALLPMADLSYRKGSFLRARAFLQRYEAVGTLDEESLLLGYLIETKLGDDVSARRYRLELIERYPASEQARRARDGE